jgi:hypothetical protein
MEEGVRVVRVLLMTRKRNKVRIEFKPSLSGEQTAETPGGGDYLEMSQQALEPSIHGYGQ